MRSTVAHLGLLSAVVAASSTCPPDYPTKPYPTDVCQTLDKQYPETIFYPGSKTYKDENENYWSPTTYSNPACVFVPSNADQVAGAVKVLANSDIKFAVRGGGHMPIRGYANTDGGVLIAFTKMDQIELSEDKSSVSVGPGQKWGSVYNYLELHGLIALGGRVGLVGVPGLLLGGGISFYSNQHGFASDNVVAFEVVLASGKIVTASAEKHSDLFWALKGGGNSFGIVTRFDLATFNSPKVCAGVLQIPSTQRDEFLSTVASFGQEGSKDAKAAVIPSIFMLRLLDATVYTSALFYDGEKCDQPALSNFTALPTLASTYGPTTLAKYVAGTDALIPPGTRQHFQVVSSFATAEALEAVHDIFVSGVKDELWDILDLQASVAFQPITKQFVEAGVKKGGNPQGVDPSKAPYFWMVQNFSWSNEKYDQRIVDVCASITAKINKKLDATGQKAQYQYLNDAGEGQSVFQNYGDGNLAKLKEIRAKYDPARLFTDSLNGGWKVEDA
ncbi:hypothetical protein AJ79_06073 [Helicocarpus griseus UAMH5409]|uniref:FAD-binding PCMH-type domain-containing protein n=1 Tax=Helicocarpus griseus UAMH5409 TaxID=1447875 RepID=A0A2B7XH34_9EURO|nr:hypothetical protein AJ79_06073 [Helicocarpus griseus UAMH5409]